MVKVGPPVYQPLGRAVERRNFRLGVVNGLFVLIADTFIDPTLVLVTFVNQLTANSVLIGLVAPLRDAAWFLPQLGMSGWLQSRPQRLDVYRWSVWGRVLVLGALVAAVAFLRDRTTLLVVFFVLFTIYAIVSGVSGLPFLEVVGKTVPPSRRATFFAWRLFSGGVFSLGAAAAVRWLLSRDDLAFPVPFAFLFGAAFVFYTIGWLFFLGIQEPPALDVRARVGTRAQLLRAWSVVRGDLGYRHFLTMRLALTVAGAAVPFFAVHAQRALGGTREMVGLYLGLFTLVGLTSNAGLGRLAPRIGNQRIMLLGSISGLVMALLVAALLVYAAVNGGVGPGVADLWLVPVFVLSAFREACMGVAGTPLLFDVAQGKDLTLYLGFTNSIQGIALLATGLSGVVVEVFGFSALLGLTVAAYAVAIWAARLLGRHSAEPEPVKSS